MRLLSSTSIWILFMDFNGMCVCVCDVMMSLIVGLLNHFIIERNESYNEETSIASPSVHIAVPVAVSLRNRHPMKRPRYNSFHCWHSHIQSDLNAVLIAPFCRRIHRERFNWAHIENKVIKSRRLRTRNIEMFISSSRVPTLFFAHSFDRSLTMRPANKS